VGHFFGVFSKECGSNVAPASKINGLARHGRFAIQTAGLGAIDLEERSFGIAAELRPHERADIDRR
jgi:hypothetical protein